MHAFDNTTLFQFRFRHATNAVGAKVGVTRLNASQAAQIFVAGFLPLGNQVGVGDFLVDAVLVQLTTDGLPPVEEIVDVSRFLMMNFEDGPQWLVDTFSFVRLGFSWKIDKNKMISRFGGHQKALYNLPSRIFCSNSSSVGSMSSQPSGGGFRLRRTFGIFDWLALFTKKCKIISISPEMLRCSSFDVTIESVCWFYFLDMSKLFAFLARCVSPKVYGRVCIKVLTLRPLT